MEIAEQIVVINEGRIEQAGHPTELYDRPANPFVMSFLGPVSKLAGTFVRPHDIELLAEPEDDAVEAMVDRVARMGFEVRVALNPAEGEPVDVQITRGHADELEVEPGQVLWLRADPLRSLSAR